MRPIYRGDRASRLSTALVDPAMVAGMHSILGATTPSMAMEECHNLWSWGTGGAYDGGHFNSITVKVAEGICCRQG